LAILSILDDKGWLYEILRYQQLVLGANRFSARRRLLLDKCSVFRQHPNLFGRPYIIHSRVLNDFLKDSLAVLRGDNVEIDGKNSSDLRLPCADFDFSDLEASVLDFDSGEEHNADSDRPESWHQPVSLISVGSSEDCGVSQFEADYRWELKPLSEAHLMETAGFNAGNDLLRRGNQRPRADVPVQGAEPPIRWEQLTSNQLTL
jgi:hypothetical protein